MDVEQVLVTVAGGAAHGYFTRKMFHIPWQFIATSYFLMWLLLILPHPLLIAFRGQEAALSTLAVLSVWWGTLALSGVVGNFIAGRLIR